MVNCSIKTLFLTLLFVTISTAVYAAPKIVNVNFEGLLQTDEVLLRETIKSVEGTPYSERLVSEDIKSLYLTGQFEDIRVEKRFVPGGIILTFVFKEKWTVGSIQFRGNEKFKDKELVEIVSVTRYSLLDERRIAESEEAIRKLYEKKGFYAIDVDTEIVPLSTVKNELEVTFVISEKKKVRIRRVSFVGNKAFEDKELAKVIRSKVKGFLSFLTGSGKLEDQKLEVDQQLLTYHYLKNGYIKVKVGRPQISLTKDKESLYLTFPVYEGPQYTVSEIDVSGDVLTSKQELISEMELKKGDIYNRELQDKDNQYLIERYGDQAYAFANVYPSIETNDDDKTAKLTYYINKGNKIAIERIIITGNDVTRDKVIRRELRVQENAPYNRSGVERSKKRLMQLGYFEEVNFSTPRGSRDDTVDLIVDVKEKSTGTFSVGAGFSTLENFIFTAQVQKDNLLGRGLAAGLQTSLSTKRQDFRGTYSDRYFFDTNWQFSLSAFRTSSSLNRDFDRKAFGGSVSFGRELFDFFTIALGYSIEDVSIGNFSPLVPQFFIDNSDGLTSSVINNITYDTRDNRFSTTKGVYINARNEYAGNGVGGDNDFWKLYLDTRAFFPIKKTVLKARGAFGYINSLNDDSVPLFERYFLGGINTLRGFDNNTIGPEMRIPYTATGADVDFVFGGNRMFLFNLEYEIPVYTPAGLKAVVFVDSGQAFAEDETIDITEFRSNYGVGFRWNSPFGPLRFEWGFPFNKKEDESFTVFNFSIGQSF